MTESEIIEGNRLIAEFMELSNRIPKDRLDIMIHKYHKSWDCLMPVVKRIEGLNKKCFNQILITAPIEIVWQTAVTFIQWHNSVKTK